VGSDVEILYSNEFSANILTVSQVFLIAFISFCSFNICWFTLNANKFPLNLAVTPVTLLFTNGMSENGTPYDSLGNTIQEAIRELGIDESQINMMIW